MSKERFEELETKYSTLTVSSEKNGTEYTEVDVEDLVFLIQNGFKQSERVQELEEEVDRLNGALHYQLSQENIRNEENRKLKYKNKRYREAIEVAIHNMAASDNLTIKFALGILEQALEGEDEE